MGALWPLKMVTHELAPKLFKLIKLHANAISSFGAGEGPKFCCILSEAVLSFQGLVAALQEVCEVPEGSVRMYKQALISSL